MTDPHRRPGLLRRLAPRAVALAAAALVATAVPALAAPGDDEALVRAGHLSVGVGEADVWMVPFSGGDPMVLRGIAYRDVTDYAPVDPGQYTVSVRPAGARANSTPMISATVDLGAGTATSVFAVGDKDEIRGRVFTDDLSAPPRGEAKVRLISAAHDGQSINAQLVGGPDLGDDIQVGDASPYYDVEARDWTAKLEVSGVQAANLSRTVTVQGGGVYTVLVLPDEAGGLQLKAIADATGSQTMPAQGTGVDTGGGALAPADSAQGVPLSGLGAIAALVVLASTAGTLALRRERADRR
ncbi:DUF4397 domain-containing protein [Nocardioidaceae bacterium]|nr:DUF4397 domain-containing protein [Nocardioidaceae bacterium]